jgi:hypothetical protein
MYKLLPCSLAIIIFLGACHAPDHSEALQVIKKSFINAQAIVSENNEDIYEVLAAKRRDIQTKAKADVWEPKANAVKELSAGIIIYINSLQKQLSAAQQVDDADVKKMILETGDSLYARLVRYNTAVVQVLNPEEFSNNPMLEAQLRKDIENFQKDISVRSGIRPGGMHGKITNLQNWKRVCLDEGSPILVMAMLNKIEQDVLITENGMIEYINSNLVNYGCVLSFEKFQAIAVLSSSYIKTGQEIEVAAGLGAFSRALEPAIFINGIKMRLNDEGVALYKLKATSKPGKYTVPVMFDYIKSDGSRDCFTKKLQYIIAE